MTSRTISKLTFLILDKCEAKLELAHPNKVLHSIWTLEALCNVLQDGRSSKFAVVIFREALRSRVGFEEAQNLLPDRKVPTLLILVII